MDALPSVNFMKPSGTSPSFAGAGVGAAAAASFFKRCATASFSLGLAERFMVSLVRSAAGRQRGRSGLARSARAMRVKEAVSYDRDL
jgi:hypothetical protein